MKLIILICVALLPRRNGRRMVAEDRLRERSERAAFERGYSSALAVKTAIDEPVDHKRSAH